MSDLKRLRIFTFRDKPSQESLISHALRHLEELFYPVPTKIIYCYEEYQKEFDDLLPNVELMEGFPDNLNDMIRGHDSSLVVLDDLMSQCSNDQRVADIFTRGSHHRGISVLYLTQNLFPPGKLSRTISLNSHYFVIFQNPRDSFQRWRNKCFLDIPTTSWNRFAMLRADPMGIW